MRDAEGKAVDEVARAGDGIKQPPSPLNLSLLKNLDREYFEDLENRRISHLGLVILGAPVAFSSAGFTSPSFEVYRGTSDSHRDPS